MGLGSLSSINIRKFEVRNDKRIHLTSYFQHLKHPVPCHSRIMQDIFQQIENIHSELSKMNLADKMGYIIGKQAEIDSYANQLAQNRILRGFFTLEEKTAVRQLQEMQNELDAHKADVNREIHHEIDKDLFKTIINLGRLV